MHALIVGAGVGGPTLAHWLRCAGHEVTLVERAPRLRTGGYLIDFWESGFDVADRMGIVPRLLREGYRMRAAREVGGDGRTIATLDPARLAESAGGGYVSIVRSDLARAICDTLDDRVELILGDTVTAVDDRGDHVHVEFEHAAARDVDLVFGADGLHSRVRALVFGPESAFERDLGMAVAAFDVTGYRPRDELVAVMHGAVGSQSVRVSLRDDLTLFLLTFLHRGPLPEDGDAQRELVREAMSGAGGETTAILAQLPRAHALYLDHASQIRMPTWHRGRIALLGDAAASPSLLAGQGSALAMVHAYLLAAGLVRSNGDHAAAFEACERRLMPMIIAKQDAARGLGGVFAPRSRARLLLRNATMRVMGVPGVARAVMGRSLRDPIEVPEWTAA